MRFTKLRLNGFKSFVDPTELVIREGLTGVVGPNGCGKSNLLEALRWVMGENRPTAMRGSGMEDVVFAGTASRPARAFAEVALTLDNGERLAPAGFNDADVLEVARRITRDAGSAYRLNGKEVRARDVQMLFADASTGAHSPALVRQGQISELINARPKARRRVLEEAAGISGLYQRRHEAELRLNATEVNLARVSDVVEQLAAQLVVLARQARQAARYREIGAELRRAEGMYLLRRWREAEEAREALRQALTEALTLAARGEREAHASRAARERCEDALPPRREEEAIAGAILQRLQVQREQLSDQEARARDQLRSLGAQIERLHLDAQREAALSADADEVIARLEWEAEQLERAGEGHDQRLSEAQDAAETAAEFLAAEEAAFTAATEDTARLAARHQSLQRMIDEAQQGIAAAERAAATAKAEAETAHIRAESALEAQEAARDTLDAARELAESAEEALAAAEAARSDAQTAEVSARATRAAAEGEEGALSSELSALERLMAREAPKGGQILDQIRVEPGYETALGAALGEDLRAPASASGTGWRALPPLSPPPLPEGLTPLASVVQGPAALQRRLSQVALVDSAAEAERLHPRLSAGQRLVTRAGDLWRWDGLVTLSADMQGTAALRLMQMNRLAALQSDLTRAEAAATAARQAHEACQSRLATLAEADRLARDARRAADQRLSEAARALSRAEGDAALATARGETAALAAARTADALEAAQDQADQARAQGADLPDLNQARAEVERLRALVETARQAMLSRRAAHEELRRDAAARRARAQEVARERQTWASRKATAAERVRELHDRALEATEELEAARAAPEEIALKREELSDAIASAETRRTAAIEALIAAETALRAAQEAERAAERAAGEAREARARAEARVDAAAEAVTLAAQRIHEETEASPADLLAQLGGEGVQMPDAATLETEIARLKRAREGLGAVNLRAEEDALSVQTEHDALVSERADLEAAVAKLRAGINALNREGRERLLAAFEQVNTNFGALFTHLFGGGEARLVLVESDDPLEAGLEILCQPPGKKLSSLSLLSGGEQTLTALALIFGVFLANPAPICVLDEVDAPLDDANVVRFCDLLDEMTRRTETRFLIITHNALTMARMDRLFGVTMAEQGVSQLVSVDLKRAEALVA